MNSYIGEIRAFAGDNAPHGWALCDGAKLSVTANHALYSLLGTSFGGDGMNDFALPDLRGRIIVSQASKPGTYLFGSTGGQEKVTLRSENLPGHQHDYLVSSPPGDLVEPASYQVFSTDNSTNPSETVTVLAQADTASPESSHFNEKMSPWGSTNPQSHENRMPYLSINYIICIDGQYPPIL